MKKLLLACTWLLFLGLALPVFAVPVAGNAATPIADDGVWYYVKSQRNAGTGPWWTFGTAVVPGALTKADNQKFTLVSILDEFDQPTGKVTVKEFGGTLMDVEGAFSVAGAATGWTITPQTVNGIQGVSFPGERSGLHQGASGWNWEVRAQDWYNLSDYCTFFFYEATDDAALKSAIDEVNVYLTTVTIGTGIGEYPQSAADDLNAAIATAQGVADNSASTTTELDNAIAALATAKNDFLLAKAYSFTPSTESVTMWYAIKNTGRPDKKFLTNTEIGTNALGKELTGNDDQFLWKIVQTSPGEFNIIGKANNGQVDAPTGYSTAQKIVSTTETYKLNYLGSGTQGDNQYNLIGSSNIMLHLDGGAARTIVGWNGSTVDNPSAWIFQDANGTPGAPTSIVAVAGNQNASVTITPGAATTAASGSISSYTVTSNPGNIVATGTSPVLVEGLTNGVAYTFTATATNQAGTGPVSAASNEVTPSGVPNAPTAVVGTSGNTEVSVAFTAPVDNGTPEITGYTVTSTPGSFTATGAASPLVVTGLTNGTSYTFTVVATNENGNSVPSVASAAVVPSTVPDAPSISGIVSPGNTEALITIVAPSNTGGAAIVNYTVTSSPAAVVQTASAGNVTITGLTNGVTYTFTAIANNIKGSSEASAASPAITPTDVVPVLDYTGNTWYVIRNNSGRNYPSAYLADNGTAADIKTDLLMNDSKILWKLEGSAAGAGFVSFLGNYLPTTVSGNTNNGTTYSTTTADLGWTISYLGYGQHGVVSGSSLHNGWYRSVTKYGGTELNGNSWSFIKVTAPDAPTNVVATPSSAQASVAFTAPTSSSVFVPTEYTVTSTPGGITATGAASPILVTGLTNGTSYTFTVTATNIVGTGSASVASNAVTPDVPTSLGGADGSTIVVKAINRILVVTGTDAAVRAYTASGVEVDTTKALKQGVYIVKVAGLTTKVLVQ